jgi:hypothetical protein
VLEALGSRAGTVEPPARADAPRRWAVSPTTLVLVGGVVLWAVAVRITEVADVGAYGLTPALGAPFVVAVLAVCLAFAAELLGRARPLILTAAIVALTVMLRASAPLLLAEVEYPWTYKHFGVVELFRQAGRIVDPTDIYQQWPAFFAAAAHLSDVSGVAPIDYAAWSPLLFSLIDALLLAAAVRVAIEASGRPLRRAALAPGHEANDGLELRDRRIVFLTVFLFEACLWVDTNYFSPQAYAFALVLGFLVIMRGWLYLRPEVVRRRHGMWRRPAPATALAPSTGRFWPTVAAVGVFAVVTMSHQLSPFIILAGVGTLGVMGRLRPRLVVVLLFGVTIGYVLPRLGGVISDYSVFSGFNLLRNAAGNAGSWGSDAQRFSALSARGLALVVWGGGLLALWRLRRQSNAVAAGILAFSPFVILAAQSYGGEAVYRVFLFSLPWCALLIAACLVDGSLHSPSPSSSPPPGSLRRGLTTVGVALALSACSLAAHQGLQGQFAVHAVATWDLHAARYFYAHAPVGSALLLGAQNFPARLTADYGRFNVGTPVEPALTDEQRFRDATLEASWLPDIEDWARSHAGTRTYLVVSRQMAAHAEFFGDLRPGALAALTEALRTSRRWEIFYEAPGVIIFRLRVVG